MVLQVAVYVVIVLRGHVDRSIDTVNGLGHSSSLCLSKMKIGAEGWSDPCVSTSANILNLHRVTDRGIKPNMEEDQA